MKGLKDASPAGNLLAATAPPFNCGEPLFTTLTNATLPSGAVRASPPGLPVLKRDPWTMNPAGQGRRAARPSRLSWPASETRGCARREAQARAISRSFRRTSNFGAAAII